MELEALLSRSQNQCELCRGNDKLQRYVVAPDTTATDENCIVICSSCQGQIEKTEQLDPTHWETLSETMWSEHLPVQIVAWRMLSRLRQEAWASDLLDILYLDEDALEWAKKTGDHEAEATVAFHQDVNGTRLFEGDQVVLIKTLPVKGSSLSAKLGTVVKNIRLVPDNTDQIEGKIDGQMIVILTKFLRKG
ncbi:MAG TPA: PhnA domain-containing protein [Candidatus Sphingobacterium stercorigallinarum]|nr:PhnA domain-containing protein [Candidatus Sphingobacterium stercorigallinarum]